MTEYNHFWVRRTQATDFTLGDLGSTVILASGGERNLLLDFSFRELYHSSDLAAAITGDELVRLDGPGGTPIPKVDALIDLTLHHQHPGSDMEPGFGDIPVSTHPDDADMIIIWDASENEIRKQSRQDYLAIFGASAEDASEDAESSTTSKTWVQKVRLTTTDLIAGRYRVGYQMELRSSGTGKNAAARIQVDDTATLGDFFSDEVEHTPYGGFGFIDLAAGVHTVDIDFAAPDLGVYTAYIQRARIEFWRVG